MDLKHLLKFLRLIESVPLEYMVTGSVASILYGKPRLTQDMDVVVVFPLRQVDKFIKLFDTEEYYCPPPEAIEDEIKLHDKGHLNVIDQSTGFKIDLYPVERDALAQWGLKNRKEIELIAEEKVWVAPPEYVILKKMTYYKEGGSQKHMDDIKGMLEVSTELIDKKVIKSWTAKLGIEDIWSKISPA